MSERTSCWPWSHRWSKWKQMHGEFVYTPGPHFKDRTPTEFTKRWQERTCEVCGKLQREEIEL